MTVPDARLAYQVGLTLESISGGDLGLDAEILFDCALHEVFDLFREARQVARGLFQRFEALANVAKPSRIFSLTLSTSAVRIR